jgi:hypothetical protein
MVEQKLPKLTTGVRFPSPAPIKSMPYKTTIDNIPNFWGNFGQMDFVSKVAKHKNIEERGPFQFRAKVRRNGVEKSQTFETVPVPKTWTGC